MLPSDSKKGDTELLAKLGGAFREQKAHEIVHFFANDRAVLGFEREHVLRCLEVAREQESRSRAGAVHAGGPACKIHAAPLFDEAEELPTKPIHLGRLQDGLDRFGNRENELLHVGGKRETGIANRECSEKNLLETASVGNEELHEVLFAEVPEVSSCEKG